MARRRPRKADHPDFLSDAEVAAIWAHAAECYAQIDNVDEQIVCLKTAAEYAPEDSSLRLKLADAMRGVERDWAAANQLEALLAADPNNVDALLRLAAIQHESWYGDPASLWRRVLAIDPTNFEAREGLAQDYLAKAGASVGQASSPFSFLARPFFGQPVSQDPLKLLENGLKELGEHPGLLLELGRLCAEKKQRHAQARSYLLRAFQADPNSTKTVGPALHEMLHASGGEMVEQLLPQARQMPGLLPAFWMDQARMVLDCKLGQTWAARFFDEGVKLAELKRNSSTPASVLAEAFEISHEHGDKNLAEWYEERIRDEAPGSGALDYIAGYRLYHEQQDLAGALRLMRKAKQAANKAHDSGVAALAEQAELMLPAGGSGGLGRLLAGLGRQGLLPDFLDDFEDDEEGW
jgi:tetratricopeptide (TPR) repeat protein